MTYEEMYNEAYDRLLYWRGKASEFKAERDELIKIRKDLIESRRNAEAERDRYREDLEFVHKALVWEERRCGRLHGVLASAIEKTRATFAKIRS